MGRPWMESESYKAEIAMRNRIRIWGLRFGIFHSNLKMLKLWNLYDARAAEIYKAYN